VNIGKLENLENKNNKITDITLVLDKNGIELKFKSRTDWRVL